MTSLRPLPLAAVMLLAGLSSAMACRGTEIVASAEASTTPLTSDVSKAAPNLLTVTLDKNRESEPSLMNIASGVGGLCADVQMTATTDPKDSGIGVTFWQVKDDDFYFLELHSTGEYRVVRRLMGKGYALIPFTAAPVIKPGLNQWNEVELRFTTGGADLYINGTKVNEIIAHPSSDATLYGIFAESPTGGPAAMQVRALRLVK